METKSLKKPIVTAAMEGSGTISQTPARGLLLASKGKQLRPSLPTPILPEQTYHERAPAGLCLELSIVRLLTVPCGLMPAGHQGRIPNIWESPVSDPTLFSPYLLSIGQTSWSCSKSVTSATVLSLEKHICNTTYCFTIV